MRAALAAFSGAFLGMLLLGGLGDFRERQSYASLIQEKDSLAGEVEMCRRATMQLSVRLTTLERRRRR